MYNYQFMFHLDQKVNIKGFNIIGSVVGWTIGKSHHTNKVMYADKVGIIQHFDFLDEEIEAVKPEEPSL